MKKLFLLFGGFLLMVSCNKETEGQEMAKGVTLDLSTVQSEWSDLLSGIKSGPLSKADVLTDLRGSVSVEDPTCFLLRDVSNSLEAATENKLSIEYVGLLVNSNNPDEKYPKFRVRNFTEATAAIYYNYDAVIEMELTDGRWRALQLEYVEAKRDAWITSFFPTTWFEDIFGAQLTGNWRVSRTPNTNPQLQIDQVNPEVSIFSNEIQSCDTANILCKTGAVVINGVGNMQNGYDENYTLFINGVQIDRETGEKYLRYGLAVGTAAEKIRMKPVTLNSASGTPLVSEVDGVEMYPGDIVFFSLPLNIYESSNPIIVINFDLTTRDGVSESRNLSTSLKTYYDKIIDGTIDNTLPFMEHSICKAPEYDCNFPQMPVLAIPDQFQVKFMNNPSRPGEEFVFWPVAIGQSTFDIPLGVWDVEVISWPESLGTIPEFTEVPVFFDRIEQQNFGLNAIATIELYSISSYTLVAKNNLKMGFTPSIAPVGQEGVWSASLNDSGNYWTVFPFIGESNPSRAFVIKTLDVTNKEIITPVMQSSSKVYRIMVCPGGLSLKRTHSEQRLLNNLIIK